MMSRFVSLGIAVASLLSLALLIATQGEASVTVGQCSLPVKELARIFARGECDDILNTTPCGPEDECDQNNCLGDSYNLQQECIEDCQADCAANCYDICDGDPDCTAACIAQDCQGCQEDCNEVRNVFVRNCVGPITASKNHDDFDYYDPAVYNRAESEYTEVYSESYNCFWACTCSSYCYKDANNQWYCETLNGPNCAPSGMVDIPVDATPGECPDEDPL